MNTLTVGAVSFGSSTSNMLPLSVLETPESTVTKFTAGFLLTNDLSWVALIEKQRPAYLKGKLNGIGGHMEPGETPLQCQIREFREETGMTVNDWTQFATLRIPGRAEINFFYAFASTFSNLKQMTDEKLVYRYLPELHGDNYAGCVPNLRYLLPMALLHAQNSWTGIYNVAEPV